MIAPPKSDSFCFSFTWSWTSLSHSSRHRRFSNGLKSASLKWKCGNSTCSFNNAAIESWMHCTAFFEIPRSLWQAASMKCGPKILQIFSKLQVNKLFNFYIQPPLRKQNKTFYNKWIDKLTLITWISGRPLLTHFSITSPSLESNKTFNSSSLGLLRRHQNFLLSFEWPSVVLNNWSLLAWQSALRNEQRARRFNFNAAFSNSLSTSWESTQIIFAA